MTLQAIRRARARMDMERQFAFIVRRLDFPKKPSRRNTLTRLSSWKR
jgi:hypothetical protein